MMMSSPTAGARSKDQAGRKPYEIGRGRTPVETRWKKGQSGNREGARLHKKKRQEEEAKRTAVELRLAHAYEIVRVKINGRWKRMTRREHLMLLDNVEATKSYKVRKQLLDRWEADEKWRRQFGDESVKPFDWGEEQEKLFRELEEAARVAKAGKEKPAPSDDEGEEGSEDNGRSDVKALSGERSLAVQLKAKSRRPPGSLGASGLAVGGASHSAQRRGPGA